MNKIAIAFIFLFVFNTYGQSEKDLDGSAQVYFLRSTGTKAVLDKFKVFIDDTLVCKLSNKKYSVHVVAPGEHVFSVQASGTESKPKADKLTINTEAGKIYYVQLIVEGDFLITPHCEEISENTAKKKLAKLKVAISCE